MQHVYSNVSKVMVESRNGSNLLYLPLDKLMQQAAGTAAVAPPQNMPTPETAPSSVDARARDDLRSRAREGR
jgi:membrane protease subunit HflK